MACQKSHHCTRVSKSRQRFYSPGANSMQLLRCSFSCFGEKACRNTNSLAWTLPFPLTTATISASNCTENPRTLISTFRELVVIVLTSSTALSLVRLCAFTKGAQLRRSQPNTWKSSCIIYSTAGILHRRFWTDLSELTTGLHLLLSSQLPPCMPGSRF